MVFHHGFAENWWTHVFLKRAKRTYNHNLILLKPQNQPNG